MNEYNWMAPVYDPLLHAGLYKIRKRVTAIAHELQAARIIDICCGTGNQLKYLHKHGFRNVTGVDLSDAMLKQVDKGGAVISCDKQDATAMEFDAGSFDLGIISLALHEKSRSDAGKIMQEARRIIRTGGHLMVVDYVFDSRTSLLGRAMVTTAEFFAGRQHYKNFRKYLRYGGLHTLENGLAVKAEYPFHRGATRLRLYAIEK